MQRGLKLSETHIRNVCRTRKGGETYLWKRNKPQMDNAVLLIMNVWYAPQIMELLVLCVCACACMFEIGGDELHGKTAQIWTDILYCSGLW
jgi:hypothetical protein